MHYSYRPLLRGGVAAPFEKMARYLKYGAAGEGRSTVATWSALPGCARSKVAFLLFYGRSLPLPEGGERLVENETSSRRNTLNFLSDGN